MIKESRKEMKENGLVYCLEVLLDLLDCNHTGICVCVYTHKRVTWRGGNARFKEMVLFFSYLTVCRSIKSEKGK